MFDHQCYIHLVDLIEFSGFGFFGSNATVTSAMSLLERIFFWRPDALPLLGGIKASKHTTASSSSLLPFVHVRQCVTSGDSKNKQKMCFVAGGEGEGSPVGWNLSPTIPSLLSPTPPKEGCCCWRSSLNSPTYSPRSSSSPLTLFPPHSSGGY